MNKFINLLCVTLVACSCVIGTAIAKIPLSSYGNIPDTSLMTISASGKYIGFRKTSETKDVYIVFSLEENKIVGSVDVGDSKPNKAYFVKDDQIILVVGKYQQTHGFYSSSAQHTTYALSYNIKKKKLHRLLVPGKGIYDNQWGLGYISGISSNADFVYMPAYVGGLAMGEWQGLNKNLMQSRLSGSRKPRSHSKGTEFTRDFFVDDNDNVLARVEYDNKEDLFTIQKYEDGEWINIFQEKRTIPFKIKGITPDKKHLVFGRYVGSDKISNKPASEVAVTLNRSGATKNEQASPSKNLSSAEINKNLAYFTMRLSDGKISDTPLYYRDDASVESVVTDINRIIYGVKYSGFLPKYEFSDKNLTLRLENISKSFANTSVHLKDWSEDWKHLLVYIEGQESSGEYIIVNEKNEMNIVGMARPSIPYTSVHPISTFNYKATDGLSIPALLTKPKSWDGKSKLPTIMLPHGGPESYNNIEFNWLAQSFAEQGYLVIQPQFRGSTGFGLEHKKAGRGEWGKKMQSDLSDALAVIVKKGLADPQRVCIVGGSYGGYAALAAGAFTPDLYKCIISFNGVSDVEMMLEDKEKAFGDDHWVISYWDKVIVNNKEKNSLLVEISPVNHVEKFTAPVLLIHSENDGNVPFEQSQKMHEQLQEHNKKSIFIELEKDDHYLSYNETRVKALTEITMFLKEYL